MPLQKPLVSIHKRSAEFRKISASLFFTEAKARGLSPWGVVTSMSMIKSALD